MLIRTPWFTVGKKGYEPAMWSVAHHHAEWAEFYSIIMAYHHGLKIATFWKDNRELHFYCEDRHKYRDLLIVDTHDMKTLVMEASQPIPKVNISYLAPFIGGVVLFGVTAFDALQYEVEESVLRFKHRSAIKALPGTRF